MDELFEQLKHIQELIDEILENVKTLNIVYNLLYFSIGLNIGQFLFFVFY